MIILAVAAGGFGGGIARYLLSRSLPPLWGTFSANMLACLLLGYASTHVLPVLWVAALGTGIAGALSTWSTLAKELGSLLRSGEYLRMSVYLLATVLAGVALVKVGAAL